MDYRRDFRNECYHCKHKRSVAGNAHIECVKPDTNMRGNEHGIRNGWFYYPFLYDPTWKEKMCNNYEPKEIVNSVVSQSVSVAGESK